MSILTSRASSQYAAMAANTDFDWDTGAQGYMDPWTVCGWWRLDTLNAENYLLALNDQENGWTGFAVEVVADGRLYVGLSNGSANQQIYYDSPGGGITAGTWFHVAVTCSEGNDVGGGMFINTLWVYVDKVQLGWDELADYVPIMGEPSFWMRRGYNPTPHIIDGASADLRLYNRELASEEIKTIYNARGTDMLLNGLVSRWRPIGSGQTLSTVPDIHSGGNDWTAYNSPTAEGEPFGLQIGPLRIG